MHPLPAEHARSLKTASLKTALLALLLLFGGLAGAGCTDASSESPTDAAPASLAPPDTLEAPTPDERAAALDALTAMRRTAFDTAFARLENYAFTRFVRTEQLDADGAITAVRQRTLRYGRADGSQRVRILHRDSSGTFQASVFQQFASSDADASLPEDVAQQAFPSDPAYLAARTREAFTYRFRSDTLYGDTPVHVVEVRARPTREGRDQSIRYARLYLDRDTHELLAAYTVRAENALLFSEHSQFFVRLRRAPDGPWVPDLARFRSRVDVPFRAPQQFHTVSAYYGYETLQRAD